MNREELETFRAVEAALAELSPAIRPVVARQPWPPAPSRACLFVAHPNLERPAVVVRGRVIHHYGALPGPDPTPVYTGRGWRAELVDDVVRAVLNPLAAARGEHGTMRRARHGYRVVAVGLVEHPGGAGLRPSVLLGFKTERDRERASKLIGQSVRLIGGDHGQA